MKKNKILFPKKVALLLGAAAVLLLGSTVGSTRAALTYYSENYSAQMNLKHIGVSLVENGQVVSSRDYVSGNEWSGNTEGKLLASMLGENEKFTPGKQYDEAHRNVWCFITQRHWHRERPHRDFPIRSVSMSPWHSR